MADVRTAPCQPTVVARAGRPPAQARITAGLTGDDRRAAVSHDDQAVRGERLQGVPDDAGADALQRIHLGDRRQFVAWDEDPSRIASVSVAVTCAHAGGARVNRQHRDITVLDKWLAHAGQVWEPVSGFEPLASRLQEVRPHAPRALAAPVPRVMALTAIAALELSCASFHEPFHMGPHYDRNPA